MTPSIHLLTTFVSSERLEQERATMLILALSQRSPETAEHSLRVASFALSIGREMGLSDAQLCSLWLGALLHDVGKIAVPDAVLHKRERLTPGEWVCLREHPWRGANLIEVAGFSASACAAVGQHHERWDGTGYPHGLKGEAISLEARIVAVADTYDAITRDRCYRRGECHEVALNEIVGWAGIQFDPAVVEVFLQIPREKLV